ncbi:MAG: class III cytochrome C family protein [Rhizobiaceae bacterium]
MLAIPLSLYSSGSGAPPFWRAAASPGPLSKAHAFLENECGACHTPNKGVTAAACMTCHATDAPVFALQAAAFHADIKECRFCHIEHQGGTIRPTRMDHTVLARIGWGKGSEAATKSGAMSEIAHFLARSTGAHAITDIATLDCNSCHQNRDPHRGLMGRECAECHQINSWKIAGFLHPSPQSQECAQCHQAPPSHYMMHFHMISMMVAGQEHAKVEQCFMCHQSDSWNNIKGVGWYKHH